MALEDVLKDAEKVHGEFLQTGKAAKEAAEQERVAKANAEAGIAEPKVEPKADAAPDAKAEPKAEPASSAKDEPAKDEAKLAKALDALDDDGEKDVNADEKGNVSMPFKAFERRIARAGKAHLKAIFGTDDREAILKMKSDYEAMLKTREEDRRSKMDEVERLKEDKRKAEEKAAALEAKEKAREEAKEADDQEQHVNTLASAHIKPSAMDLAHYKFAKYLKRTGDYDMSDEDVTKWFKEFAEKNQDYAKAPAPAPKKDPVNIGAGPKDKPSPKGGVDEAKTVRNMSSKELQEWKRKSGYAW